MKTLEDAREILKLCQEWRDISHYDDKDYSKRGVIEERMEGLCCGCCPECSTPTVLHWVWPELKEE